MRRPGSAPVPWLKAPAVTHASELHEGDTARVCVPAEAVLETENARCAKRMASTECLFA